MQAFCFKYDHKQGEIKPAHEVHLWQLWRQNFCTHLFTNQALIAIGAFAALVIDHYVKPIVSRLPQKWHIDYLWDGTENPPSLVSRYSKMPSEAPSRPIPLCFMPPNG